jgi:hypothetical protein
VGGGKSGSAVIVTSESKVCTVYFDWNLDSLSSCYVSEPMS